MLFQKLFHGIFFTAPTTDYSNKQSIEGLIPWQLFLNTSTLNWKGRNLTIPSTVPRLSLNSCWDLNVQQKIHHSFILGRGKEKRRGGGYGAVFKSWVRTLIMPSTPQWRTMDCINFIIHIGSRNLVPLYVDQWIQTSYSPNYEDE